MGERTVGVERSERALVLGSVVTMAGVLECTVDYPAAFQVWASMHSVLLLVPRSVTDTHTC